MAELLTEKELLDRLRTGQLSLPPLRFEVVKIDAGKRDDNGWDLLLDASWESQRARFAAECKSRSTPKAFEEAVRRSQDAKLPPRSLAMIVLPYLRESQLVELERRGISGIDLCGNGVVVVPGKFSVFRTGGENRFPSYAPIKNIYRRNTSMVGRALLANPVFQSVQDVRKFVNNRNPLVTRWGKTPMGLGTVSKALKGLEDDLTVDRREGVRLLQAEKLIDNLQENYEPPRTVRRVRMKVEIGKRSLSQLLRKTANAANLPVVATGLSSVSRYAVMQRENVLSVYCPRSRPLQERLAGKETDRFPNVELIETDDQPPYFDARDEQGFPWASPLQTYLELMAGDKRDRETAEQVRDCLLRQTGAGESVHSRSERRR